MTTRPIAPEDVPARRPAPNRASQDRLGLPQEAAPGGPGKRGEIRASGPGGEPAADLPRDRRGRLLPKAQLQHQRYQIRRVLPAGGMGGVYQAFDLHLKHFCAIKEMLDHFHKEEQRRQALEWFEREAQMLLKLHHPMIPRIFDFFTEDDHSYLVMEFIEGRTLAELLEQEGQPRGLPPARVCYWGIQICNVLAYLHSRRPPIIFRDLKPSNIMLTNAEEIRLIDFGIARIFAEVAGTPILTPGYAPIEQMGGFPEPRSDLYALGATMYQLLTLQKPGYLLTPVRQRRPEISPAFEHIIQKALEKDAYARWASASEMEQALRTMPAAETFKL